MIRKIKKYKYLLLILGIAFLIFVSVAIRIKLESDSSVDIDKEEVVLENDKNSELEEEDNIITRDKIFVDIKGAVMKPGVYEVESGKRVIDVVDMAGGLNEQADTSLINMAKKVEDSMVIIIYTVKEVEEFNSYNGDASKVVDNTCVCPNVKNDGCLEVFSDNNNDTIEGSSNTSDKVNINTASVGELQTLPGIGEEKAKNIIEYRDKNGLFSSIEDIINVSGIGESIYEKIKNYITI